MVASLYLPIFRPRDPCAFESHLALRNTNRRAFLLHRGTIQLQLVQLALFLQYLVDCEINSLLLSFWMLLTGSLSGRSWGPSTTRPPRLSRECPVRVDSSEFERSVPEFCQSSLSDDPAGVDVGVFLLAAGGAREVVLGSPGPGVDGPAVAAGPG